MIVIVYTVIACVTHGGHWNVIVEGTRIKRTRRLKVSNSRVECLSVRYYFFHFFQSQKALRHPWPRQPRCRHIHDPSLLDPPIKMAVLTPLSSHSAGDTWVIQILCNHFSLKTNVVYSQFRKCTRLGLLPITGGSSDTFRMKARWTSQ